MMKGLTALGVDMELAEKAKKRNFILALAFTIGLIAGIPCIVVGATNMGDNKGFVALLVFGIVGTVLGFYGSPLMWTRLATVNQELTVVRAVTQEHLYTVADLAQRLSVNGKTASDTLNNCIRKGYLVGYIREGDRLVLNENRALGPTQYTLVCSPLLRQRPLRPRQALTRTTHLTCTNHHFNTQNARFNRAFTDDISRGISRGQYIIIKGLK